MRLTNKQYLTVLKRQKQRISDGLELNMEDSTTVGDKYTHNSWGLCSKDKEAWPNPEEHLWPDQFEERGRVAPKYQEDFQFCTFDRRTNPQNRKEPWDKNPMGCFYHCEYFSNKGNKPTREEALEMYDQQIIKAEDLVRNETQTD